MDKTMTICDEHRKQCEEGVIGAAMANPLLLTELNTIVKHGEFLNTFLGTWYEVASDLHDAGKFTTERLRGELRRLGYLQNVVELESFAELTSTIQVATNAIYYAHELARLSRLQKLRYLLERLAIEAEQLDANPDAIAGTLEAQIDNVRTNQGALWESVGDVASRVYENHRAYVYDEDRTRLGTPTGYAELDQLTGGFFPGQLWQIAARSYMGKSTVALAFAQEQMARANGVYFASYEMENEELAERLFADRAGTSLSKFTQGNLVRSDLANMLQVVSELSTMPLFMDDRPPDSVSGLRARVKLAMAQSKINLVIVDHLLLFPHTDRRTPRHQQLVEVTRDLKQMAKDLELTVMVLNQLNSDADGEEPTDKNFSESKAVLQNLDVSILLHRETKMSEDMLCKVTKSRKGHPGQFNLQFFGEYQRVHDPAKGGAWVA